MQKHLTVSLKKNFGLEPSIEFGMLSFAALPMSGVKIYGNVLFQPAICRPNLGQTEA